MQRAVLILSVFAAAALAPGAIDGAASACPMCKAANESDADGEVNNKPRAYMVSILFMLAMPATLAACFGIGLYRVSRRTATGSPPDAEQGNPGDGWP